MTRHRIVETPRGYVIQERTFFFLWATLGDYLEGATTYRSVADAEASIRRWRAQPKQVNRVVKEL